MRKQLQAIIFDLDGVITDTAAYHYLAWKQLASDLNIPFSKEFNEELKGISRTESLEKILANGGRQSDFTDEQKMQLSSLKNDHYLKLIQNLKPADILPGIKTLIDDIKTNGLKLGLASASKNAFTVMKALELENDFDCIVDANTIKNGKPNPEIFLTAAQLLKVEVAACIGIEDAVAGIEAIKAAGMYAIAIGKKEVFNNADFVVEETSRLSYLEIVNHYYNT